VVGSECAADGCGSLLEKAAGYVDDDSPEF
jgi:hypothetical protein